MRRHLPSPGAFVAVCAAVIAAVHAWGLLVFAWRHCHFANYDLQTFWDARTLPFGRYLLSPIDDHFVPLHRVVCFLLDRAAPMSFGAALAILGAIHVATLVVLWRILEGLRPGPLNVGLVALYGLHASLGPQYLWWSAGLGRLGCGLFSSLAVLFYLRHREDGARRPLAYAALATAGALGFYAKGVMIPVYVGLLELALRATARPGERAPRLTAPLALVPVILAYLAFWWANTPPGWRRTSFDVAFHARFIAASLPTFAANVFGFWLDERVVADVFVAAAWALAVGITASRAPRTIVAWGALAVAVAASMSLVAASALRAQYFGVTSARLDRYYFDPMFLVPVFAAIAARVGDSPGWLRALSATAARRWGLAASAVALLAFVAATSAASNARIQANSEDIRRMMDEVRTRGRARAGSYYAQHEQARVFTLNLEASLALVPDAERHPLTLVDTPVPWFLIPWGDKVTRSSELLYLLGEQVQVRNDGSFVVGPDGHLLDARRWRSTRPIPP